MINSIIQDLQYIKQALRTAQALMESLSGDLDLPNWPTTVAHDITDSIGGVINDCMELEILIIKEDGV